jgi:hypothetical protein
MGRALLRVPFRFFVRFQKVCVFLMASRMPLCQCGHAWGDHAMAEHIDYDIDDGKRPCFALADDGECRCPNYVASLMDALKRALPPEHVCGGGMNPPFPGPCAACERERE